MDKHFAAFGRSIVVGCKRKSTVYDQFMLACLLAHLPHVTALPGPFMSPPVVNQTVNNGPATTFEASIHEDNPLTTITFGVFSTVIAFGSFVVGVLQYRRWKIRHSTTLVDHDEEMHEISQHYTPSDHTVVEEARAVVTPPLRVLTSPLAYPSPITSRASTIAIKPSLVEPGRRKGTETSTSSMAKDTSCKEVCPSPSTKSSHDGEHLDHPEGVKLFTA